VAALARGGRPVEAPVSALLSARAADGSWSAEGDRHCAGGGREFATAVAVVGLSRTYLP
jgi:hypothetical protein